MKKRNDKEIFNIDGDTVLKLALVIRTFLKIVNYQCLTVVLDRSFRGGIVLNIHLFSLRPETSPKWLYCSPHISETFTLPLFVTTYGDPLIKMDEIV